MSGLKHKSLLLGVAIRPDVEDGYRHLGYIVARADKSPISDKVRVYRPEIRWRGRPLVSLVDFSAMPPMKAATIWPLKKKQTRRAA